MNRLFSKKQRIALAMASNWKCLICGIPLPKHWHSDHKIPFSKGGKTDVINGQALCPTCNLKKGNKMNKVTLRKWQEDALSQALFKMPNQKLFLTHATPGGGKTLHGLSVFDALLNKGDVSHVVVVAPSTVLINQWQSEAINNYGADLKPCMLYQHEPDFDEYKGIVMAYQSMHLNAEALRIFCSVNNVLVIADELHHVSDNQSWGDSFRHAFEPAKNILGLTGTPWSANGYNIPYVKYKKGFALADASYLKPEAIADKVCRITQFHPTVATNISFINNETGKTIKYDDLQSAIDDDMSGAYRKVQQSVLHMKSIFTQADEQLSRLRRSGQPRAGGLLVAPDIKTAHLFKDEIMMLTGQDYPIVHSKMDKPHKKIDDFRDSGERWLISVDMVTEGVDIKRLQVCLFLSTKTTELFVRQVIGRIERRQFKNAQSDEVSSFYYTSKEDVNAIVLTLEKESAAGKKTLDDQIKSKNDDDFSGSGREFVDDQVTISELESVMSRLIARGYEYSEDVYHEAIVRQRTRHHLGDVDLYIICKMIMSEKEIEAEIDATSYAKEVPLSVKKTRIRKLIHKEINRKMMTKFNGDIPKGNYSKAQGKINRAIGLNGGTDDSVSMVMLERKLEFVTNTGVELWLA